MDYKEKHTLFFDRLRSASRIAMDNSLVQLGGPADAIKIRLKNNFAYRPDTADVRYAWGATCGIFLTLQSTTVLRARIDHDIMKVTADGKSVEIPFYDDHIRGNCRVYKLTFFDENAACLFCWNYQRLLPRKAERRLQPLRFTYHEMVRMAEDKNKFEAELKEREIKMKEIEKESSCSSSDFSHEMNVEVNTTDDRSRETEEQDSYTDDNKLNSIFLDEQFGQSQAF